MLRNLPNKVQISHTPVIQPPGRSSSGTSSSGEAAGSRLQDYEGLFDNSGKVAEIAKAAPGALTASLIGTMRESLVTSSGQLIDLESGPLPALCLQYQRVIAGGKMGGPMAREALTISYAMDVALQGKISECLDTLTQRLKSLHLMSEGTPYTTAQRAELLPLTHSVVSRAEHKEVAKEALQEWKARG